MKTSDNNGANDKKTGGDNKLQIPSISLPKGGGALKNIDEKFQVNAVNGTASFSIALPFSKTRGEFIPAISLNYNSGSGNGPYGQGWHLDYASIQRKTDQMLPNYQDADDGDVFMFSGAEDLVPELKQDASGNWVSTAFTSSDGYQIKTYRPRIESGFSRIEQIRPAGSTAFYWKVTSRNNIATFYGRSAAARIADPANPDRIFSWLPEISYDDKGNCIEWGYINEDFKNVPDAIFETNRLNNKAPCTSTYIKRIKYGNKLPYYPAPDQPYDPPAPADLQYFFETVFDYGDHNVAAPAPAVQQNWPCRTEPFSNYKPGFEIRTYRLCQRVLFFHNFKELGDGVIPSPCLVRSIDFSYRIFGNAAVTSSDQLNSEVDYIISIAQTGYLKNSAGGYDKKSMPPVAFDYQELNWNTQLQSIDPDNIVNAPAGITGTYQWVDLWNEGVAGILLEQSDGWYYKSNLGDGKFTVMQQAISKPSFNGLSDGSLQLQDLDADGRKFAVSKRGAVKGYFELADTNAWEPFQPFTSYPNINFNDPSTRLIDLNGDGIPEVVISDENVFTWYPNYGTKGYQQAQTSSKLYDQEDGTSIMFRDPDQCLFLADMSGDGMTDVVRIRNGEVCYWPNLGYGRFGAKVSMAGAPTFDHQDTFNPVYLQLADINGTGTTDIIYRGRDHVKIWLNRSGNALTEPVVINALPAIENPDSLSVIDLLGNGTACLVWSSPLAGNINAPLKYIDLMGGNKPYIMKGYKNNFGKQVSWNYKSSTYYYLADKKAGTPWVTRLPFPVQCISDTTTSDDITQTKQTCKYAYHHGFYDHQEKEFRGFGMVEQADADSFEDYILGQGNLVTEKTLFQMPVLTKTWYHPGAFAAENSILTKFSAEYFQNPDFAEHHVLEPIIPSGLTLQANREAYRACKGNILRQEVYGLDDSALATIPYSVAEHNIQIRLLQEVNDNRNATFLVIEGEAITYHYERNTSDPRVTHSLTLDTDELGNTLQVASIAYPRQVQDPSLPAAVAAGQQKQYIIYSVSQFSNDCFDPAYYRLRICTDAQSYELTGIKPAKGYFTVDELKTGFANAAIIPYEAVATESIQKRLIGHQRQLFLANNTTTPLPLGKIESLGLLFEAYRKAFTPSLLTSLYGNLATPAELTGYLTKGHYLLSDKYKQNSLYPQTDANGEWWIPSGKTGFNADPRASFYLPVKFFDPVGNNISVTYYEDYNLLISKTTDGVENTISVDQFDWRVLSPQIIRDSNNNKSAVRFDILGYIAGSAIMGKGDEADDFENFSTNISDPETLAFFTDPETNGPGLLKNASSRFVYDFSVTPVRVGTIVRETHAKQAISDAKPSPLQYSFEYSDGEGRVVLKKIQAEPGEAKQLNAANEVTTVQTGQKLRWIGNGRAVLNNKGKPIKQFQPYFSVTPAYENDNQLVAIGTSPVLYYDPPGRLIKSEFPNGTFSKTKWDAWQQLSYDPNDTVENSDWYAERTTGSLKANLLENGAAQKADMHHDTPVQVYLDSLGRSFYATAHNRFKDHKTGQIVNEFYDTHTVLDAQGHELLVIDARGNNVVGYKYDMSGCKATLNSMDSSSRWVLNNCMGKPLYAWDSKGQQFETEYDAIHRPKQSTVKKDGQAIIVFEKFVYGEGQANDLVNNLRGQLYQHFDQAGLTTSQQVDFKGNLLIRTLQLTQEFKTAINWGSNPALQPDIYTSQTFFDALNRPVKQITPHKDPALANTMVPVYGESGMVRAVNVFLKGSAQAATFVKNIAYDEKGQRIHIQYGNDTVTNYTYDEHSFRITRLVTTRKSGADILQDLNYTYDPVGNITHLQDNAQDTFFFANKKVDPDGDYTYDAVYRLTEALGREQMAQQLTPDPYDSFRTNFIQPGDGNGMQTYKQQLTYDPVGNLLQMNNVGGWNRQYTYAANSNRLLTAPSSNPAVAQSPFNYDEHGNMLNMPHLPQIDWNFKDQLSHLNILASAENNQSQQCWYVYNAEGQRIRKVVVKNNITEERLYLGEIEIFTQTVNNTVALERETMHLMDGTRRVALVDTLISDAANSPKTPLIRYQLSNHLGTACLELDAAANIISYEEYYPFGSSSYVATGNSVEVPAKRYRYTGKERDGESGLYYHGSRYYAPWLARWTAADPTGTSDGVNVYIYAKNNPILFLDPTGNSSSGDDEKPSQVLDLLSKFGVGTDKGSDDSPGFFQSILDTFSEIGKGIANAVSSAANWIAGAASTAWNWIKGAVTTAGEWVKEAAVTAWNWAKGAVNTAWNWIKGAAVTAWNATTSAISTAWNWVTGAISTAWNWIKGAASTAWNWIKGAASTVWQGIKAAARFTWNWIIAPVIRTISNTLVGAALGFLIGGLPGAIAGGAVGMVSGAIHGWAMASAHSYDWSSAGGWASFILDNTWSAPNSFIGSLWASINIFRSPIDKKSKDSNALVFTNGLIPGYATTFGNVIAGTNPLDHELSHTLQARIFGPTFYPLMAAHYVINTVLPYWLLYHKKQYPTKPITSFGQYFSRGVYPHTWAEEWGYSIEGEPQ
ncbi:SpvB/TcaC N-terminal domain-containing protein [Mucilaginibacter sabulilitoris]|uniref:SpvB/TcaC N-terminal domain-containing protein n=1 Tax=Mucilaginibacter sabulilitoris TaxID=1173583 RepID=A0ABZ0TI01_9SPHI|nr:SpvB/TcaC N-terminal domain-containing protein [Mucilaginibacter sabulilitoris]WPU92804.1 SpvB/TcaC N-terminal domain-containing protein [Mucilaginibacter sabulilitoris]